jgi:hypothetical protein
MTQWRDVSHDGVPVVWRDNLSGASSADRKPMFTLYADLQASASKSWLVHGMLGADEVSAWYGPPGCGKGVIIGDMALHIAAGLDWHGKAVTSGAVLYVALERKKVVERRAIAFRLKYGHANLPFAIAGGVYDFRDPMIADRISSICWEVQKHTKKRLVLIIVDTLSRALAGGDENSPKDMGALVATVAKLQEQVAAHVLLVHHIPHDTDRLRGHGALLGAVDTSVSVSNGGGTRSAKVVKTNDGEEGVGVTFTLESVTIHDDGTAAPVAIQTNAPATTGREPKLTKDETTMFEILFAAGQAGLSTAEWDERAKEAGVGERRRANRTDARNGLARKNRVREFAGNWTINHRT